MAVLIRVISMSLGTADESHQSYYIPNALSPFISLHVLEWFSIAHEIKKCKIATFSRKPLTLNHSPLSFLPRIKSPHYNLRRKSCEIPKISTVRSMGTYVNKLVFKYNLALE